MSFRARTSSSVVGISLLCLSLVTWGCSSTPPVAEEEPVVEEPVQRPTPDYGEAPEGYSAGEILGVFATPGEGAAVMLGSSEQHAVLPIFINPSQALAIQLGLDGEDFQRPLTHDLVVNILGKVEAEIGKVQVDELRGGTFYATIFLITPQEILEVDARPSDALALAVKGDIPIYVSDQVMEEAGVRQEDFDHLPPAEPGDPEDFDDAPTTPL